MGDAQNSPEIGHPQAPLPILRQCRWLDAAKAGQSLRIELGNRTGGIHMLDLPAQPAQPLPAIRRGCQRTVHRAQQTIRLALKHRQLSPVRAQIPQPATEYRQPQGVPLFLQKGADGARDIRPPQRYRLGSSIPLLVPQTPLTADPMLAFTITDDRLHRIGPLKHGRPRRLRPAVCGQMPHPQRAPYPKSVRQHGQRVHHGGVLRARQWHRFEAIAAQSRQPLRRTRPDPSLGIHRQGQHRVRWQTSRFRTEVLLPIGTDPGHPAAKRAQPHGIALQRHRPDIIALQCRQAFLTIVDEPTTVRLQHAHARPFHRNPHAVVGIHQQGLHIVPGQALGHTRRMPPDAHAHAIVAGQPVCRTDPQIALMIAYQRLDVGGWQALCGPDDAKTRPLGNTCDHAGAPHPQQH